MLVPKKRLVGLAASMTLFAMFGLVVGQLVVGLAGVGFEDPIDALATGPTPVFATEVLAPFDLTPKDVGLQADSKVVLPAIPVTVTGLGVTVSVSGYQVAQVTMGGGAAFGFLVGTYYLVVFAYEDSKKAQPDDPPESEH